MAGYFSLSRRVRRDPTAITTDAEIEGASALRFATTKVVAGLAAAAVINVIFGSIFEDVTSIWDADLRSGVESIGQIIQGYLLAAGIPLATVLSAWLVTRFAISADLRGDRSNRTVTRQYLLSDGSVGFFATILVAIYLAIGSNVVALQNSASFDIYERLGLRDTDDPAPTVVIPMALVFGTIVLMSVTAFVQGALIFVRSFGRSGSAVAIFRALAASAIVRLAVILPMVVLLWFVSLVLAAPVYWGALTVREKLGLESAVYSSQVANFMSESLGHESDFAPPTVPSEQYGVTIFFNDGSDQLDQTQIAQLEDLLAQWDSAWNAVHVEPKDRGQVQLSAYSTSMEMASRGPFERELDMRRAERVQYFLARNGVPPDITMFMVLGDLGDRGPCVQLSFYLPLSEEPS